MENKIKTLISLARTYFEDNDLGVEFKLWKGKVCLEIGNCEWSCGTFENCVDEAIKDISEWYEDDNQEEWKRENEIAKAVENL